VLIPAISGRTKLAAVIGDPVDHSRSPAIHNAAFAVRGLDWRYVAFRVRAGHGGDAIEAMRVLGIEGLSVTMPHKADVARRVDERTAAAEALGVCNCVFRRDDRLVGDSTDGDGFVRSLLAETDRTVVGAAVIVFGAGGAARSIVEALGRAGAGSIGIINRTAAAAAAAAALAPSATVASMADVPDAEIIVNASSIGMLGGPAPDRCPLDPALLRDHQLVADIVYTPRTTPLLAAARERGIETLGGIPMLVHQAVAQFEYWTGVDAPVDAMRAAADPASD
jgi:shikimate dehydrogenase